MYFLVKDILEKNLLEGAKLRAGKKGLSDLASWVVFMEILDALDSLQSGDILVTTGFQIDDEERYKDLILQLKMHDVCALIIQTGYYIDEIPPHILSEADQYGLPVIEIPPRLTFSGIMRSLLSYLNYRRDAHADSSVADLKKTAAQMGKSAEESLSAEDADSGAYFFLLSPSAVNASEVPDAFENSAESVKSFFLVKASSVEMKLSSDKALYYVRFPGSGAIHNIIFDLNLLVTDISRNEHVNLCIGASTVFQPNSIGIAFDQANSAYHALANINVKKGVCHYEDIHFFEWFENFHEKSNALSFSYDILKPLINYDYFHKNEYLKTLLLYLINDCKISETSEQLFIHRHTLTNRLERISQMCNADFSDYFTKLHFSLAILTYLYFLS